MQILSGKVAKNAIALPSLTNKFTSVMI